MVVPGRHSILLSRYTPLTATQTMFAAALQRCHRLTYTTSHSSYSSRKERFHARLVVKASCSSKSKRISYLSSPRTEHRRINDNRCSSNNHHQFRRISSRKSSVVVRSSSSGEEGDGNGSDEEKNENDASSSNNSSDVSMSFAEELRKRGIKEASDIKSKETSGSNNNPFGNVVKAVKSPFASSDAAPKPPPRFAQRDGDKSGASKEEDDQLKRSRLLNSEGLEGFPTRAGELLKLAVTSTVSFAPLIAVISVITIGTWSIFGADFIHGGVSRDFGGGVPNYVAPETLLAEPTVDTMVPLRSPIVVDEY